MRQHVLSQTRSTCDSRRTVAKKSPKNDENTLKYGIWDFTMVGARNWPMKQCVGWNTTMLEADCRIHRKIS